VTYKEGSINARLPDHDALWTGHAAFGPQLHQSQLLQFTLDLRPVS